MLKYGAVLLIGLISTVVLAWQVKKIKLSQKIITVELASTQEEQHKGLMGRRSLKTDHGMLFVFEKPKELHFWMKDTLIALSIGFFDAEKKLIKTLEMVPASPMDNSPQVYSSEKPAQYALEMPAGWFKKNKIKVGERFFLLNSN